MNQKDFCIIIPYRDRKEHLDAFLSHYKRILPQVRIYVIEQAGNEPFNRAKLLNVGFLLYGRYYKYCAYHDVDMLAWSAEYYSEVDKPTCIATNCSQFSFKMPYPTYFGGVTLIPSQIMVGVDGFNNHFKGWGGEDDEMYRHLLVSGAQPTWRQGYFCSLEHERIIDKLLHKKNSILCKHKRSPNNGLQYCEFTLVGEWISGFTRALVSI